MTALAVRGSRFHNGVSRLHGQVSRQCSEMWPQITAEENPIDYVTNGVHVSPFCRSNGSMSSTAFWVRIGSAHADLATAAIDGLPDDASGRAPVSQVENAANAAATGVRSASGNQGSEAHLDRLLKYAVPGPNVLTIGFGRAATQAPDLAVRELELAGAVVVGRGVQCCSCSRDARIRPMFPDRT
jgi:starch phosphorylase